MESQNAGASMLMKIFQEPLAMIILFVVFYAMVSFALL